MFSAQPQLLLFGLALQFTVMPALGFAISRWVRTNVCGVHTTACRWQAPSFPLPARSGKNNSRPLSSRPNPTGLAPPPPPCVPCSPCVHPARSFAGLDPAAAIGITLLSACPGGTASNIVCFIANVSEPAPCPPLFF